jgi:hypothetical protein
VGAIVLTGLIGPIMLLLIGCSSSTNTYRVGEHGWAGDSIYFRVYKASDSLAISSLPKMKVSCSSCNLVNPPEEVHFDGRNYARVYIPESLQLISARLRVRGHGVDTTFIQKQRPPNEAQAFYKLSTPLVGRVLISQFAPLYLDSTQDSVVATANIGDEMNLFDETTIVLSKNARAAFYLVHHPMFSMPLYLLKDNAVRLY